MCVSGRHVPGMLQLPWWRVMGEQARAGDGPQEMGTCFLETCATWLPARGRNVSFHPGPKPRSICSRKGLLAPLSCPVRAEASSGLPAKGGGGGFRGREGRRAGAGGSGERALGILSNPSFFAERSSYSGALKSKSNA